MAYMNQTMKKEIMAKVKAVTPKSWKVTAKVIHHSTLQVVIRQMPKEDYISMCHNAKKEHFGRQLENNTKAEAELMEDVADSFNIYSGSAERSFDNIHKYDKDSRPMNAIKSMICAINSLNYDKSDPMTDYFNTGYYADLSLGEWDKPCKLV